MPRIRNSIPDPTHETRRDPHRFPRQPLGDRRRARRSLAAGRRRRL